jgi:hypothetical protein
MFLRFYLDMAPQKTENLILLADLSMWSRAKHFIQVQKRRPFMSGCAVGTPKQITLSWPPVDATTTTRAPPGVLSRRRGSRAFVTFLTPK